MYVPNRNGTNTGRNVWSRLLEAIQKEGWITRLDQYEKVLKEYFSEQVGEMYISYVQSQAEGHPTGKCIRRL